MILKMRAIPMIDLAPRRRSFCLNASISCWALKRDQSKRYLRPRLNPFILLDAGFVWNFVSKDDGSQFFVINWAALIVIVGVKQRLKLLGRVVHAYLLEDATELLEVDWSFVLDVEELEHLNHASLFGQFSIRLLNKLVFELFFKSKRSWVRPCNLLCSESWHKF